MLGSGLPFFGAEHLFARARSDRGLKLGKNLRLIKLADSPDAQGHRLNWETPGYHDRGRPMHESGHTHPWIGKPGYGIRYHEAVVVGIHPDETYTVFHGGYETVSTNRVIGEYAPGEIHVVARHTRRGGAPSERPSTITQSAGDQPSYRCPHPHSTPEYSAWWARQDKQVERWQARRARMPSWYFPEDKRIVLDDTGKVIGALWPGSAATRWHPGESIGPAPLPERVKPKGRGRRVIEAFTGGPR